MPRTLLGQCPVCGQGLAVTELTCPACQTSVRGRFVLCKFCRLEPEQLNFLETFLRCRGIIREVERELGLSYPTVRSRLDELLTALGYPAEERRQEEVQQRRQEILAALERGEISVAEAARQLREG